MEEIDRRKAKKDLEDWGKRIIEIKELMETKLKELYNDMNEVYKEI